MDPSLPENLSLSLSPRVATGSLSPALSDPDEAGRCAHTGGRRSIMDGTHLGRVREALQRRVGVRRADAWADLPILSTNPLDNLCRELAVLYSQPPRVRHDDAPEQVVAAMDLLLRQSGVWGLMGRVQRYTLGLRECLVRLSIEGGRPVYRPAYPDMISAIPREDQPDQPIAVRERRIRTIQGKRIWTVDILDCQDPDRPVWEVRELLEDGTEGQDLSPYLWPDGSRSGGAYPYRQSDGAPVLPYILYHAERTGDRLWDPYSWIAIVDGSMSLIVKANMLDHTFLQASWPQRYVLGAQVVGVESSGTGRAEVITDPAVLLQLERSEGFDGQPLIGQFQPGGDVEKMAMVLEMEAARLAAEAGVPASDLQRQNSARSGAAISLSNEGKRAQQRRYAVHFRDSDQALVSATAAMANRAAGRTIYPEDGWSVLYQELPLSPDELDARRRNVRELLADGLISRVDAFRELNPGLSETAARTELAKIDAEKLSGESLQAEIAAALEALAGGDTAAVEASLQRLQGDTGA